MKKILTAALAVFVAAPSWAMGNIKVGGLKIDPFVMTNMKYDSNIYLSNTGAKSAWINDSAVGVRLDQQVSNRLKLEAGYQLDVITYSENQAKNNAVHHMGDLALESTFADDMSLKVADIFMATTDPASSELTARALRDQNDAVLKFNAPIKSKFGFKINGSDSYTKYLSSTYDNLNRNRVNIGADITYQLQPKTQLQIGYGYSQIDYKTTKTSDSGIHTVNGGVTGQIAPKVTGEVIGGVQFRNYKHDLTTTANNVTTFSYGLKLNWTPGENSTLTLRGVRDNIESVYVNSRYYTSTLTDLNYQHKFGKIVGNAGLGYEYARYPEVTTGTSDHRKDNYMTAKAGVDYNIQSWLTAGLNYQFRSRNSNENGYDYDDNQVAMQVKVSF